MDVDIDVQTKFDSTKVFPTWTKAAVVRDGRLTPHPCGVYPQAIARDPLTQLAAIPYDAAEEHGYLKVDFLHVSVYDRFKSRQEIDELVKLEPNWTLLQLDSTHPKLFQLSKHGDLLKTIKPRAIDELGDCMALIRPGKKTLAGLYTKQRAAARTLLYAPDPESGYAFKKSHALAYAYVVVLQLHLIERGQL